MSDELAKIKLKDLIALGQLDLKRGKKEVECTEANRAIAEERIRKRKEEARRLAKLKAPKPPKKGYRICPLTIDEKRDCDRLMGLFDEDIALVARILRANPIVIQAYWLNKSREKKVK